jgi:hypothetical protein
MRLSAGQLQPFSSSRTELQPLKWKPPRLYAFQRLDQADRMLLCHQQMAVVEETSRKGRNNGGYDALEVIGLTAQTWQIRASQVS